MVYVYAAMEYAKQKKISTYLEIVDCHWEIPMQRPLHVAGFLLNPKFYFEVRSKDMGSVGKFEKAFYTCIERMFPDVETQDKTDAQLSMYMNSRGTFGIPFAIRSRDKKLPSFFIIFMLFF